MTEQHDSRMGSLIIWASALVVLAFLAWANWAELDQISRARGQVIASSRNQVIQTLEGGILSEMAVREGMQVRRGQLLARFDRTAAEAGVLESDARAAAIKAAIVRLKAEMVGGEPVFPPELGGYRDFREAQEALFRKRRAALDEEIASLQQALSLIQSELEMNLPLLEHGDVSKAEILRLRRQVTEIQAQIANRRNRFFQEAQAELAKAQEELASLRYVRAGRQEHLDSTVITAPMDGVVRNIRLTTLGGVARPGDEIMQIVPRDDELIIEAKVSPADIAFLRLGLPAAVKLDAYDYTVYGTLAGEVHYISADTLSEVVQGEERPFYRVQVKTRADKRNSKSRGAIEIQPGMTATVEIRTGRQSVWRYLTKPVTKMLDESLGER